MNNILDTKKKRGSKLLRTIKSALPYIACAFFLLICAVGAGLWVDLTEYCENWKGASAAHKACYESPTCSHISPAYPSFLLPRYVQLSLVYLFAGMFFDFGELYFPLNGFFFPLLVSLWVATLAALKFRSDFLSPFQRLHSHLVTAQKYLNKLLIVSVSYFLFATMFLHLFDEFKRHLHGFYCGT